MFVFAILILISATAFAVFRGGDWQAAALGGLFGSLLAAMNHHMPLLDWLYPPGDEKQQQDD